MSAPLSPARERVSRPEGRGPARAVRALALALLVAASAGSCGDGSPVNPDERRPALVVLDPTAIEAHAIGALLQVDAVVLDQEGEPIADAGVDWSVDDPDVLESQGEGVFRTIGEGTSRITATVVIDTDGGTANGQPAPSASVLVTVDQRAAWIDVVPAALTLWALDQKATLQAEVKDAEGTPMQVPSDAVSWSVTGTAVVEVDGEGRITALEDGSGRVTGTFDNVTGEASVLVDASFSYSACVEAGGVGFTCAEVVVTARDGGG